MDNILVDTNVLIDYSKGKSKLLKDLIMKQGKGEIALFTNAVIIAEFFTDKNLKHRSYLMKAYGLIKHFNVFELTKNTGLVAGKLLRDGRVNAIGDSLIAANCLVGGLKLATRNKKHFEKVPHLKFITVSKKPRATARG
ncbi:MAG: PIN domain-containing protein [Patescibacteria group bacterium]